MEISLSTRLVHRIASLLSLCQRHRKSRNRVIQPSFNSSSATQNVYFLFSIPTESITPSDPHFDSIQIPAIDHRSSFIWDFYMNSFCDVVLLTSTLVNRRSSSPSRAVIESHFIQIQSLSSPNIYLPLSPHFLLFCCMLAVEMWSFLNKKFNCSYDRSCYCCSSPLYPGV